MHKEEKVYDAVTAEVFRNLLEKWYAEYGRKDLPWRGIADPYRIWISEIILQQTRIAQGTDYYLRFTAEFPDVFSLAQADEDRVLKLWQGLGYYSRARNLHEAAEQIAARGTFPTAYEDIRSLKGVGDYTAAAIASFAYRMPYPVVDGNVYRVLSRIFGIAVPIDTVPGKRTFRELAERLIDRTCPDIYNSAIMDFGALQCVPKSPDCSSCPFREVCIGMRCGKVGNLPVKSRKTAVRDRFIVYLYIEDGDSLLLRKRPEGDIWQGLYEPYMMEFEENASPEQIGECIFSLIGREAGIEKVAGHLKHVLTHQRLDVSCYHVRLSSLPEIAGYEKVPIASRDSFAVPKIVGTIYQLVDRMSLQNLSDEGQAD